MIRFLSTGMAAICPLRLRDQGDATGENLLTTGTVLTGENLLTTGTVLTGANLLTISQRVDDQIEAELDRVDLSIYLSARHKIQLGAVFPARRATCLFVHPSPLLQTHSECKKNTPQMSHKVGRTGTSITPLPHEFPDS
jgi:hypothetical protein